MAFDAHKNFAYSNVAAAPSPAASGTTLDVVAGEGADFPAVPFNAVVWPAGTIARKSNAEIVRVTGRAGDTLTIARQQEEGYGPRSILVGDQIAAAITAKTVTDIEVAVGGSHSYLGKTAVGASFDALGASSYKWYLKKVTPSSDGLLASIDAHVKGNGSNANLLVAAVFDDNAGVPGKIISGAGAETSGSALVLQSVFSAVARWASVPQGVWLAAGVPVWLVVGIGNAASIAYDAGGSDLSVALNQGWVNEASLVAATNSSRDHSIRGNFVVPGGGGSGGGSLDYVEKQVSVTCSATSEAAPTSIIASNPITFDGVQAVVVEFFSPDVQLNVLFGQFGLINLWDGATNLGRIGQFENSSVSNASHFPVLLRRRLVPSAGSHTFALKGWVGGSNMIVNGGPGGAGLALPMYVSVVRA